MENHPIAIKPATVRIKANSITAHVKGLHPYVACVDVYAHEKMGTKQKNYGKDCLRGLAPWKVT